MHPTLRGTLRLVALLLAFAPALAREARPAPPDDSQTPDSDAPKPEAPQKRGKKPRNQGTKPSSRWTDARRVSPKASKHQAEARRSPLPSKGGDRDFALANHAFEEGHARAASLRLLALLGKYPDMLRIHTMLGISETRDGRYADALGDFGFGKFDLYYEREGIAEHATALRMTGQGKAAAALRLSERLMLPDSEAEITVLIEAAADLRAAGDLLGAEDVLQEAVGLYPRSSAVHGAYAELFFASGREEEGELELFLGYQHGAPAFRTRLVEAERRMLAGDFNGTEKELNRAASGRPKSRELAALYARNFLAIGSPAEALALLDNDSMADQQDPILRAAQVEALAASGQVDEARDLLRDSLLISPGYPDLIRAAKRLEP